MHVPFCRSCVAPQPEHFSRPSRTEERAGLVGGEEADAEDRREDEEREGVPFSRLSSAHSSKNWASSSKTGWPRRVRPSAQIVDTGVPCVRLKLIIFKIVLSITSCTGVIPAMRTATFSSF